MTRKKIFIFVFFLIILVAAAGLLYFRGNKQADLEKLKQDYPALISFVDDVEKWRGKMEEDEKNIENYTNLGLMWKWLADKACEIKAPNCADYYQEALEVYEKAIVLSERKNTLFMANAGNMARYLKDYARAEDYYKEAISVAPGDYPLYFTLAELYEYDMKKGKDEIVALYDAGIKRVLNPAVLESYKQEYLERNK